VRLLTLISITSVALASPAWRTRAQDASLDVPPSSDTSTATNESATPSAFDPSSEPSASPPEPDPPTESESPSPIANAIDRVRLQIHGFASQGWFVTTGSNYLAYTRRSGSFEMSEVGLNVTAEPVDQLRIGLQLFTRDLGPIGNYATKFDWFFVDYRFHDAFGIRAGRTKIPFGLYNEVNDIDAARVPILLPQSVYPTSNRDFLLAQTGGEIYGRIDLGRGGTFDHRLYCGTIFIDTPQQTPGSPVTTGPIGVPYVVGARWMWEPPVEGLRVGGSVQALKLEGDLFVGTMRAHYELPAVLWVASFEYARDRLLVAAEYGRWHTRLTSSDDTIYPSTDWAASERAYVRAAYQIHSYVHPGVYYAITFPNVDERTRRDQHQHDVALTFRFDINPYWLVKVEGHYMNGTAGLSPALNGGRPRSELDEHWAVFLVRTTAYF